MRVGVFGGSFNPPHIGHQIVAEHARDLLNLDEVLWVPNNVPPHREAASIATVHRLRMVEHAAAGNPSFVVSRLELDRDGPSYMVDTLEQAANSGDELFLIIGMDSLESFSSWREPQKICRLAQLVVYPRTRSADDQPDGNRERRRWPFIALDAPVVDVSSTAIRTKIRSGQSVRYLVPEPVYRYICDHQLYQDD